MPGSNQPLFIFTRIPMSRLSRTRPSTTLTISLRTRWRVTSNSSVMLRVPVPLLGMGLLPLELSQRSPHMDMTSSRQMRPQASSPHMTTPLLLQMLPLLRLNQRVFHKDLSSHGPMTWIRRRKQILRMLKTSLKSRFPMKSRSQQARRLRLSGTRLQMQMHLSLVPHLARLVGATTKTLLHMLVNL